MHKQELDITQNEASVSCHAKENFKVDFHLIQTLIFLTTDNLIFCMEKGLDKDLHLTFNPFMHQIHSSLHMMSITSRFLPG